jgi:iron(III) transport system permease protein
MLGIVLVQVFFFFPYALWPMIAAFKVSDLALEEASQNLGAKPWFTFVRVTLPLAMPGIVSSMLLIFTVSFSDFGTPIIMAPKDLNLIVVEAYREIAGFFNWAGSAILTVIMVLVAAFFFWLQRIVTRGKEYGTISGKPTNQKMVTNRGVVVTLTLYTSVVVLIPLLAMGSIFLSSVATTWGHHALPDGYTLKHYAFIFSTSSKNIVNSLVLGAGALVLSVIIATFVSYFVVRRGSGALDFMSSIPLVVPGIALGIALIQTFNTAPLHLTGTALILIIAYTIRRMPYMIRSTMGSMMAIRKDIEEAAINMGASPLIAAITVIGPLMLPGISAGAILVFVTVIKETSISILMAPTDWAPMSLAVFQNLLRGEYYTASAMAILIIVIVVILQYFAKKITRDEFY